MNTYRLFRRKARIRMCKDVINNTLLLNSCDLVRQSLAETEADAIIYQTVCPFRTYLPQLQSNFEITKYYCTLLNIYILAR